MSSEFYGKRARKAFNFLVRAHDKYAVVAPYLGKCVLDLGCGSEALIHFLQPGARYVGIDIRPEAIDYLKSQYPQHLFYCLDLDKDALPDLAIYMPFSSIVLLSTIEHLHNPDFILDQCLGLMNDATLLIITTPTKIGDSVSTAVETILGTPKASVPYPHVRWYNRDSLNSLSKAHGLVLKHYQKLHWHHQNQLFVLQKQ